MRNMDFWFFRDFFRKRWNVILLVACLTLMAVGVYTKLFTRPVYRSSVSLYFGRMTETTPLGRAIALSEGNARLGEMALQLAIGSQLSGDYQLLINFDVITEGGHDELT